MLRDGKTSRTLDLTASPARRVSGILVWLVVITLAAGSLYAFFSRSSDLRPPPAEGLLGPSHTEELVLGDLRIAIQVNDEWECTKDGGGARLKRSVEDWPLLLELSLDEGAASEGTAAGDRARACMSAFLAPEGQFRHLGGVVIFERFRWLDQKGGICAWEVVVGDVIEQIATTTKPSSYYLWVEAPGRVVRLSYVVPDGAPDRASDYVEQVIATLSFP